MDSGQCLCAVQQPVAERPVMTVMRNRIRWQRAVGTILVCLAVAACGTDQNPQPTFSTLGVAGEVLCGFVPKADVVAAVGTAALTSDGELQGRGGNQPLEDSGCFVRTGAAQAKVFEVVVWDRAMDNGYTEWQLKNPEANQIRFPADHPIGIANPAYQDREAGTSGAVASAVVGDWYVNLRIYRPGKGRDAVTDAVNLVQRVVAALQLPTQATRTYPPFVPSTPAS